MGEKQKGKKDPSNQINIALSQKPKINEGKKGLGVIVI
jgi:hypothetical protein